MREGLLWFDDDSGRSLADKVTRAASRYQQKYGHAPSVCYVHPTMVSGQETRSGSVRVLPARTVLPNHFWLGMLEASRSS
jgi:hypothetical protein